MRLPPYGRALTARREAGEHPGTVRVVYGSRWSGEDRGGVLLYIPPRLYAPGVFDFRLLIGLPVVLSYRDGSLPRFLSLAAEIARYAAPVAVLFARGSEAARVFPYETEHQSALEVDELMFVRRRGAAGPRVGARAKTMTTPSAARAIGQHARGIIWAGAGSLADEETPESETEQRAAAAFASVHPGWHRHLAKNDKGQLIPCLQNAYLILKSDLNWFGVLAYDEFSARLIKRKPPPYDTNGGGRMGGYRRHSNRAVAVPGV